MNHCKLLSCTLLLANFLYISAFQQQAGSIQQRFSSRIHETSPIASPTAIFTYKKSAQDASSRRDFFNFIASAGVTVAGVTAGTFAANAQTGLLPDPNGGFAKPKGLGGLPKKIRSVGNIMVRSNVVHSRLSALWVLYLHNASSLSSSGRAATRFNARTMGSCREIP